MVFLSNDTRKTADVRMVKAMHLLTSRSISIPADTHMRHRSGRTIQPKYSCASRKSHVIYVIYEHSSGAFHFITVTWRRIRSMTRVLPHRKAHAVPKVTPSSFILCHPETPERYREQYLTCCYTVADFLVSITIVSINEITLSRS